MILLKNTFTKSNTPLWVFFMSLYIFLIVILFYSFIIDNVFVNFEQISIYIAGLEEVNTRRVYSDLFAFTLLAFLL